MLGEEHGSFFVVARRERLDLERALCIQTRRSSDLKRVSCRTRNSTECVLCSDDRVTSEHKFKVVVGKWAGRACALCCVLCDVCYSVAICI